MNHIYRSSQGRRRQHGPSKIGGALKIFVLLVVVVGAFVLLVRWFRSEGKEKQFKTDDLPAIATAAAASEDNALVVDVPQTIQLTPIGGGSSTATVTKAHVAGVFTLTMLAQLPAIDNTTEAYEAWYIKPGLTDFFSLGDLYPREDGAWGLVWSVTDALARIDLGEFDKILVTREARDGNTAPSSNQQLQGTFAK
ncbi:TPA: hypothetical protein DEP96_03580 [Candidatus Uhrbacteria bacterium]|nr:hypothetical protein [Candidatus Uhrbacteria bacterium]